VRPHAAPAGATAQDPSGPTHSRRGTRSQGEVRQQQWHHSLIQLWRLLVLTSAAVGLTGLLWEKGWWLETPSQVIFRNASGLSHGELLAASKLQFPTPLLALDPSRVQENLRRHGSPTMQVRIKRLLAPPQLLIDVEQGGAQAWARRSLANRVERGLLDHHGRWTSLNAHHQLRGLPTVQHDVLVDGWSPAFQGVLAELLSYMEQLEIPIPTVRISGDGQLVLLSATALGEIHLGPPDNLSRKLAILDHLHGQIGERAPQLTYAYVDLRNPDEPQLGLYQ